MKSNVFISITKFSHINAIFWGALALLLSLFPTSALGGAFYMIAIYFTLFGVLRLIDAIVVGKTKEKPSQTASFIVGGLLIIIGAVPLFYLRYVLPMTPLYVSAILTVASIINFVLALCSPHGGAKGWGIALSLFAGTASAVAVVFSFGFGVDGTSGFARIAACAAVLLGVDTITVYLRGKKLAALDVEGEKKL